jgi:hypothetical protein
LKSQAIGVQVTYADLRKSRHLVRPEITNERDLFLLSAEIQSLLARLYGETPVNPDADHGWVRPLASIKRTDAPLHKVAALMHSTIDLLRAKDFEVR